MDKKIVRLFLSAEQDIGEKLEADQTYTDVIAVLENGEMYAASFFGFNSLALLQEKHRENGEYLHGKYFWASGMVLIDDCGRESVEEVVRDLIEEGDFEEVFRKI